MPSEMRMFAKTLQGRTIVEEELEKATKSLKRANEDLADLNGTQDNAAEKILVKTRILNLIVALQNSVDELSDALRANTVAPGQ